MNIRNRLAVGTATVALTFGLAAIPATAMPAYSSPADSASATKCADWKSVQLAGNVAGMKYQECWRTYNGKKQASGAIYLWDNKSDGKEACGKITIGNWWRDWCWGNESHHSPKYISGWHDGSDAKFGLFLA
ncbi:hypothetical protein NDR87_08485 [Nocardia sp. CDC159]|uniref:Uncharacterized protein n=1 Tax=Nocardia pulmonis TaxID=2951408 RepID=A0A9X2E3K4_9NOCA|nr:MULTISPECIES: hypothetical protein [Nocardia]MCM6773507.1 hypothetical protein [Nocardia pulmonis]MCM6786394.1 hypothetical protein [Nocardia sp. CDC159]